VPEAEDAQVEQADGDFGGEEGEHVPEDAVPAGLGGWGVCGWGWVGSWGGGLPLSWEPSRLGRCRGSVFLDRTRLLFWRISIGAFHCLCVGGFGG
jgi:hypothetical protein